MYINFFVSYISKYNPLHLTFNVLTFSLEEICPEMCFSCEDGTIELPSLVPGESIQAA